MNDPRVVVHRGALLSHPRHYQWPQQMTGSPPPGWGLRGAGGNGAQGGGLYGGGGRVADMLRAWADDDDSWDDAAALDDDP